MGIVCPLMDNLGQDYPLRRLITHCEDLPNSTLPTIELDTNMFLR